MIKVFPTLYKLDSKGKVRVWHMEIEGDKYRSVSGLQDGKLVTSEWFYASAKNIGKSNGTTPEEQAIAEVEATYRKNIEREYRENIDEIGKLTYFKPMLAASWDDCYSSIDFSKGVFVQPKLDGIRCVFTKDGPKSRNGKDIVAIPHLIELLKPLFDENPNLVLDGELYNHEFKDDFNTIVSMVRKTKPTPSDLEECSKYIQYHVYDLPSETSLFNERIRKLGDLVTLLGSDLVQLVPTEVSFNVEEVDQYYGQYLQDGYEGGIIRLNAKYEQKRTKSLLKRKDFEDAEFEIIRIEEGQGNWAGMAKRIVFRNDDGREVGAGLKGTQEYAKQLLAEAAEYIGKQVTVQFFTRTPDGVPRFPVAKALHKDRRW
jgi:DNA ligase-1